MKQHEAMKDIDIASENERLLKAVAESTAKCDKLEKVIKDQGDLMNEQTKLMKALNVRTKFLVFEAILFFCNEVVHSEFPH